MFEDKKAVGIKSENTILSGHELRPCSVDNIQGKWLVFLFQLNASLNSVKIRLKIKGRRLYLGWTSLCQLQLHPDVHLKLLTLCQESIPEPFPGRFLDRLTGKYRSFGHAIKVVLPNLHEAKRTKEQQDRWLSRYLINHLYHGFC